MNTKANETKKKLSDWEALIAPIPKIAVPVEFIKHIVFYYPGNKEVVLELNKVDTELIETWIEANYADSQKISMIVDIKKVKSFIEPVTKNFFEEHFS